MKKFISMIAAIIGYSAVCFAQPNLVATLSHNGSFTHYYGNGALQSAYDAAEDGDIITLSPGTFSNSNSYFFSKAITLRGTGINETTKSTISSNFYITPKAEGDIVIEGVYFSSYVYVRNDYSIENQGKIKFIKNSINSLYARPINTSSTYKNGPTVRLYNNIISNLYFENDSNPDYIFYNCLIFNNPNYPSLNTTAFINCDFSIYQSGSGLCTYMNFLNCIIKYTNYSYSGSLSSTASCYNCLATSERGTGTNIFSDITSGSENNYLSSLFLENWNLFDSVKEKYKGTDGTEIGIYGGSYPYDLKVQYPIITQFISDVQTSKEGILNINVEVDGQ